MIQPSFVIESDMGPSEDFSSCRLVAEVTPRTFSYVLMSVKGLYPVVLKYFQLGSPRERPLDELLRELVFSDPLLNETAYETVVVYNFPESNLVPEKYFRTDTNRQVTDLVYGNLHRGIILTEKVPWWELYNVYRLPVELHNLLQKRFTSAKFWHFYSLQLKAHKMFHAKEEDEYMKAVFYSGKMVLFVFRNGKIILAQTFSYSDHHDVTYHLLQCCRQLQLNPEQVVLILGGMIEKRSALYSELQNYFLNVALDSIEENTRITESMQEYPLHYFSPLLKMALCV